MKKGMILYVTQGKEDVPLQAAAELIEIARRLGVTAVCVALTEEDAVHGWWSLTHERNATGSVHDGSLQCGS